MKTTRWLPAALCSVAIFNISFADPTLGDELYSDPFDTVNSDKDATMVGDWLINSDYQARLMPYTDLEGNDLAGWQVEFGWDFSHLGIPPAPSGDGVNTKGLMMAVNRYVTDGWTVDPPPDTGTAYALTVILSDPTYGDANMFSGDYAVTFDMWFNYNGPLGPDDDNPDRAAGGRGSTHFATFGIGLDQYADHPQRYNPAYNADNNLNPSKGGWFAIADEGENLFDFRVHKGSVGQRGDSGQFYAADTQADAGTGVLDARDARQPYYATIMPGELTVPQEQLDMWPNQIGRTYPGTPAFAWHTVTIKRRGGYTDPEFPDLGEFALVTWEIDGLPIVTLDPRKGSNTPNGDNADLANFTTEGRIFLGIYDFAISVTDNPDALFVLYDNLKVHELLPEPEGGYDVWASSLPEGQNGREDDPDGDGISNLMEYALGLDPMVGDVQNLPQGVVEGDYLTLAVTKNEEAIGVEYVVEVSSDLMNWEAGSEFTTELESSATMLKVRDNAIWSGADRRFIRLRVTESN